MINERVRNLMNEQIKHEIYSAYLYLSMVGYFHARGLDGMAQWMRVQAQEELTHAMKFFDHLKDRGGHIQLLGLEQPQTEWASPLQAWQAAYKHEQFITGKINDIMRLANDEKDYNSVPLLNWFVNEQIEEEANTSKVTQTLEQIGDSGAGLVMLDRELGTRTFTYPAATGAEEGA